MPAEPAPVTTPRDASTVLLVRDGEPGIQVWMLQRIDTLAFAPGAWVFPGGAVVDRISLDLLPSWSVGDPAERRSVLGVDELRATALHEAAVRETFEECGLALARDRVQARPVVWTDDDRRDLLAGHRTLRYLLERDDAHIDAEHLVPWDRWLTPAGHPRRYDTWFFLVDARRWPSPHHVPDGEAVRSGWVEPDDMLQRWGKTPGALLPPTRACLERLSALASVDASMAQVPRRLARRAG